MANQLSGKEFIAGIPQPQRFSGSAGDGLQ
jgi:hypothetical protein